MIYYYLGDILTNKARKNDVYTIINLVIYDIGRMSGHDRNLPNSYPISNGHLHDILIFHPKISIGLQLEEFYAILWDVY